jgi:hypothetical protein
MDRQLLVVNEGLKTRRNAHPPDQPTHRRELARFIPLVGRSPRSRDLPMADDAYGYRVVAS